MFHFRCVLLLRSVYDSYASLSLSGFLKIESNVSPPEGMLRRSQTRICCRSKKVGAGNKGTAKHGGASP